MSAVELQARRRPAARVGRVLADVWRGAVVDRVAEGRLRDVDWPYGLRAVVVVACSLSVFAGAVAAGSSLLRRSSALTVDSSLTVSSPAGFSWVMVALVTAVLALLLEAAVHGPWWLKLLGVVFTLALIGVWGFRGASTGHSTALTLVVAALALAVLVVSVLRARKSFVWWEYPVFLGLIGAAMAVSLLNGEQTTSALGFEMTPLLLQQTVGVFGLLAMPTAVAAGTSVAEVTVGVTLVATRRLERVASGWWPYVLLAVVVVARGLQSVRDVSRLDPVRQGWLTFAPALVLTGLLGGVCWLVLRRARRSGDPVSVQRLPDELGHIALPVGAVLVLALVPVTLGFLVLQIVGSLDPSGAVGRLQLDTNAFNELGVQIVRGGLGVVLVLLAFRRARQGRGEVAVLLAATGVILVGLTMRLATGYRWAIWFDPDTLNLIGTALTVVLLAWYLVRRRLSRMRALAGAALLILSALFSSRDFVSDPVGSLLGYSGVGLVLFGVTWDFLTSSDWGNGESRRFPRPTRVLLVLANTLLILVVLGYGALVRDADAGVDLDTVAELGNLILGTGLLAATFVAVVRTAAEDRPVT